MQRSVTRKLFIAFLRIEFFVKNFSKIVDELENFFIQNHSKSGKLCIFCRKLATDRQILVKWKRKIFFYEKFYEKLNFFLSKALSNVPPLRNYFLREENYAHIKRPPGDKLQILSQRFGELIRKLWNPKAFKAHVSPHEMLQAVVLCSEKKFQIIKQSKLRKAYGFGHFTILALSKRFIFVFFTTKNR